MQGPELTTEATNKTLLVLWFSNDGQTIYEKGNPKVGFPRPFMEFLVIQVYI